MHCNQAPEKKQSVAAIKISPYQVPQSALAIFSLASLARASFKTTVFCSQVGTETAEATAMKRANARITFMLNG